MHKTLLAYLKNPYYVALLLLGIVAVAGFCLLFFWPYRLYDWVLTNKNILFWSEIGVLALMVMLLVMQISRLQSEIENIRRSTTDSSEKAGMYNFYDERGELKLSAKPENVYYIESADNYVQVHYRSTNKLQVLLIRNSMKNIEWRFKDMHLVRCHRSYIVNVDLVQAVRRIDGEMVLDFEDTELPVLPVSKAYSEQIMQFFTN
ncbi:MAG: LytTR family transcriptional regulator [Paludibacteraceae bacterium]|nr:LytTR family transcriptional regulator [Paludibacteraceae bacterium]